MKHHLICPRCQFDLRRSTGDITAEDQLVLPFAEREYVDVRRASRILGVHATTISQFYEWGLIEMLDYSKHKRKRVRYQSLVDLCDKLRQKYSIDDRRPALSAPYLRHQDMDLLPFPISDTITVEDAMEMMGYASPKPIYLAIEEGRFDAYQFSSKTPWRISKLSLSRYMASVYERAKISFISGNTMGAA